MMNTVCLCGSTRFIELFDEANRELSKCGLTVISISMNLPTNEQHEQTDRFLKELLDLVHLNKILRSDAVFVLDKDGYIGRSTAREIVWARMHDKPVIQYSRMTSWSNGARNIQCGSWYPQIEASAWETLRK
jgi:hypothetical protein